MEWKKKIIANNKNIDHAKYCTSIGLQTLIMQVIPHYNIVDDDIADSFYLLSKLLTTAQLRQLYTNIVNHWVNIQHYVSVIDRLYANANIVVSEFTKVTVSNVEKYEKVFSSLNNFIRCYETFYKIKGET